jgi:hypothetical protein
LEAEIKASCSMIVFKAENTAALWPEKRARAGTTLTCNDHFVPLQYHDMEVFNKV